MNLLRSICCCSVGHAQANIESPAKRLGGLSHLSLHLTCDTSHSAASTRWFARCWRFASYWSGRGAERKGLKPLSKVLMF